MDLFSSLFGENSFCFEQRFGRGYKSEKSKPRLPRHTGVDHTVHTIFKEGDMLKKFLLEKVIGNDTEGDILKNKFFLKE